MSALKRWHPDDPNLPDLHREAVTDSIERYVARVVKTAPALKPEQEARIIAALRGGR